MKNFCLALMAGALAGSMALAQQSPPAATGIGNQTTSPNSNVSNNPSMSPDQNQASTETRGSTTGDKGNPDLAGASGSQTSSTANAQGTEGATGQSSATAARQHAYGKDTRHHPQRRKRKGAANGSNQRSGQETYQAPTPPTSGPSTTEAPGPATGSGPTNPQPPKNPD
jgi:hypothetical protein